MRKLHSVNLSSSHPNIYKADPCADHLYLREDLLSSHIYNVPVDRKLPDTRLRSNKGIDLAQLLHSVNTTLTSLSGVSAKPMIRPIGS